ncbi:Protein IQ-DOMAIN 1 [Vigna angularis]|uniref:Protein IQ-DOMAIN 1 n=1 Tax=Phaseolus angularis TaxID=3914 RepID=A0A8T0K1Z5_PHAAN|nr:protein IQ-DOMAIN 33 isoform X2 [Vigna angularis]KAG2391124.1 Protein IQ-DOMAIN 1 [Vigna angularis]
MGFTGELVRGVFSKNRSDGSHETKVKRSSAENRRWLSVRSYLCGDEFNSVLAENDSASVKSTEVTVSQSILEDLNDKGDTDSEETVENVTQKRPNSDSKSLTEEEAAILIQSAFRGFLLRRQNGEIRSETGKEEFNLVTESPDRKSLGTSVEVQTANSIEVFSVEGEEKGLCHRIQRRTRTQVIKQKEDWDDSTVSSYVSKMRMQSRMEASTRRERALAYAFSQQLRICSKRKLTKHNSLESNMSWSWLERWMATRLPETSSVESHAMKQYEPSNCNHKFTIMTRFLDAAGEEKESCGSNEVPLHFDNYSINSEEEKVSFKPHTAKTNFKARRTVSRRKTVPSYQFHEEQQPKVSKRDGWGNASKDVKPKQKQAGSRTEITLSSSKASNV